MSGRSVHYGIRQFWLLVVVVVVVVIVAAAASNNNKVELYDDYVLHKVGV